MATVKEVVLKHHIKDDGTVNIKIRLTQVDFCLMLSMD
jgi:hypothetical protein